MYSTISIFAWIRRFVRWKRRRRGGLRRKIDWFHFGELFLLLWFLDAVKSLGIGWYLHIAEHTTDIGNRKMKKRVPHKICSLPLVDLVKTGSLWTNFSFNLEKWDDEQHQNRRILSQDEQRIWGQTKWRRIGREWNSGVSLELLLWLSDQILSYLDMI